MTETNWDDELKKLLSNNDSHETIPFKNDELNRLQWSRFLEEAVNISVELLFQMDEIDGEGYLREEGLEPEAMDTAFAIARGIVTALTGVNHEGGEELDAQLEKLKISIREIKESLEGGDYDN